MRWKILGILLSLFLLNQTVFASSVYLEIFHINNLTNQPILVFVKYYVQFRKGIPMAGVDYKDLNGNLITSTSFVYSMAASEKGELVPKGKMREVFHLHKRKSTAALDPLTKFKGVIADMKVIDSEGNLLLTYDDLTEESFVKFGESSGDNSFRIDIKQKDK